MEDRYLFRAKTAKIVDTYNNDVEDGVWVHGSLRCDVGKYTIFQFEPERADYIEYEIDPTTICQCTGMKDKNGKPIWENDVVDFFGHKGVIVCECGSFGIAYKSFIDWEEIQSNIKCVTGCENILYACENDNYISLWEIYWNFNDEDDSVNTVEVIGNIFDNPELLEK